MHIDDRFATVLRHEVTGDRAARTQFRQLLDLLGKRPPTRIRLQSEAMARLSDLAMRIKVSERAAILRESTRPITNPDLIRLLVEQEPEVATSALARASLGGGEWVELIPQLPPLARGFLRLKDNLPVEAIAVLDRLGIHDRGLPPPVSASDQTETEPETEEANTADDTLFIFPNDDSDAVWVEPDEDDGGAGERKIEVDQPVGPPPSPTRSGSGDQIAQIVERIEAFKKARQRNGGADRNAGEPTRLKVGTINRVSGITRFFFRTGTDLRISVAQGRVAPTVVGLDLTNLKPLARNADTSHITKLRDRLPIEGDWFELEGSPAIRGEWSLDAVAMFDVNDGRFTGYAGQFRRASLHEDKGKARDPHMDHIREVLHELRTPINAIQGFAEAIQQQLFGPTPHRYRAISAAVASDAARILAAFDDLDRFAKLSSGDEELGEGRSDLNHIAERIAHQLQFAFHQAGSDIEFRAAERPVWIELEQSDIETTIWRLIAVIADAAGSGEEIRARLEQIEEHAVMIVCLPKRLAQSDNIFDAALPGSNEELAPSLFGTGFALRLVRAEARSAGGDLQREEDTLALSLPLAEARRAVR